jgi:hypothetical protein
MATELYPPVVATADAAHCVMVEREAHDGD